MIETAKYRITGLVDIFDEQGVITGQYPVGSVQELSVEAGVAAVADGRAEAVADEDADADKGSDKTVEDGAAGSDNSSGNQADETGEAGAADNANSGVDKTGADDEKKEDEVE